MNLDVYQLVVGGGDDDLVLVGARIDDVASVITRNAPVVVANGSI